MRPKMCNTLFLPLCRRCKIHLPNTNSAFSTISSPSSPYLNSPPLRGGLLLDIHRLYSASSHHLRMQNRRVSFLRFFRSSSLTFRRKPSAPRAPAMPSPLIRRGRSNSMPRNIVLEPEKLAEIVELVIRDADDMESNLNRLDVRLSPAAVAKVLYALNDSRLPTLRFFRWVLNYNVDFKPSSKIYNLFVDNLGRLEDYRAMYHVLSDLSAKGHCLTDKAFVFLTFCSSSTLKGSIRRVIEVLNIVRGSCQSSGICSLIKLLCKMKSFELVSFVMENTVRKTSYYNVLIAAMCKNGDFRKAREYFDEMRIHGYDPNTNLYNYLLGSLFKNHRIVEACDLLQTMEEDGYIPDPITYEVVTLHACKVNRIDFAIEIVNRMLSEGLTPRISTHSAIIKGFFLAGQARDSYNYVVEMSGKDKCSSNMNYSLLAELFRVSGRVVESGRILYDMMEKGLKPYFPVYIKVLKELHKPDAGDLASQLKSMFSKFSLKKDAR